MLTRDQAIRAACALTGLVYHSRGDYSQPSDGFCSTCLAQQDPRWTFTNTGETLAYIRDAVIARLKAEGYTPAPDVLKDLAAILKGD